VTVVEVEVDLEPVEVTVVRGDLPDVGVTVDMPSVAIGVPGPPGPSGNGTPVVILTQAEYDALAIKDPATLYVLI
jgi:hypothetical protein